MALPSAATYATNAKAHPVKDIICGVVDIYFNRPFEIPAFESFVVNPEVLDRYEGAYSTPGAQAKAKITRDGSTLLFQPPGESSGVALEPIADHEFQLFGGRVVFEFNAAKGQYIVKQGGEERVFTMDK